MARCGGLLCKRVSRDAADLHCLHPRAAVVEPQPLVTLAWATVRPEPFSTKATSSPWLQEV